mgnify:CR=1 FL=1
MAAQVLEHRELGVERGVLEHDSEPAAHPFRMTARILVEYRHRAGLRCDERREHLEKRGFAAPIRPEHPEDLAPRYLEIEGAQSHTLAVAVREPRNRHRRRGPAADGERPRRDHRRAP